MEKREFIIKKLKEKGCRITNQRMIILDVILEGSCSSCKEIYYKAAKRDESIGTATVYRMVNMLEEIGAINRREIYKIDDSGIRGESHAEPPEKMYMVEFADDTTIKIPAKKWNQIIQSGLKNYGYEKVVKKVSVKHS